MASVPAHEILCHRMTWSLLVTLALPAVSGKLDGFIALFRQGGQISLLSADCQHGHQGAKRQK
jgi:EamA domain-containing membrane protein RarD